MIKIYGMNKKKFSASTETKKKLLEAAKEILRKEFVGLDSIIDHIIHLITPWYLYPHLQRRPLTINLWGMTGVGKTSLIKRLSELLSFTEWFYHFDMANNSDQTYTLKEFFKGIVQSEAFPFIITLDEFQYANTLNGDGDEIQKAYSRVVWDLIDTGKFQVFRNSNTDFTQDIAEVRFLLDKGVKITNGIISEKVDYFFKVRSDRMNNFGDIDSIDYKKKNQQLVKPFTIQEILTACPDLFETSIEIQDLVLTMNGEETLDFLERIDTHIKSRRELDCSQALIFVLGNLDEAYGISGNLSPDIDADEFHKRSKSITINQIKSALQNRFRNEQIARLGNNHIIYPALNKKSFRKIISNELDKLSAQTWQSFNIKLSFDTSIHNVVYNEGVYPAQGIRPLFSTIQHLVVPHISFIPAIIEEKELNSNEVVASIKRSKLFLSFISQGVVIHQHIYKLQLHLHSLRLAKKDELQAVTAVHESGHAITSALLMGMLPTQIFSVTSDVSSSGFIVTENVERMVWNKMKVINRAAVYLSGLVAEKLLFGDENITTGAQSDLYYATRLISDLVKKQGMGGEHFYVDVEAPSFSNAVFDEGHYFNEQVKKLLIEASKLAENVLQKHQALLIDLSQYLSIHSFMSQKIFLRFLIKHNCTEQLNSVQSFSYRQRLNNVATGNKTSHNMVADPLFISLNKNAERNG